MFFGESNAGQQRQILGGRYSILRELGRGTSGVVHLCRRRADQRLFAVKEIFTGRDVAERHRISAEARLMLNIPPHPSIVALEEVAEGRDAVFLVLEYAPEGSMQRIVYPLPTTVSTAHNGGGGRDASSSDVFGTSHSWGPAGAGLDGPHEGYAGSSSFFGGGHASDDFDEQQAANYMRAHSGPQPSTAGGHGPGTSRRGSHQNLPPIPEADVVRWFSQLAAALAFLHSVGVAHRDIKLDNILVCSSASVVKICDFGVATTVRGNTAQQTTRSTTMESQRSAHGLFEHTTVGTPQYMAPEICDGRPHSQKCDVWSLGVTFYEVCARRLPFDATNMLALMHRIMEDPAAPLPPPYSAHLSAIVLAMLAKDPSRRPSMAQITAMFKHYRRCHAAAEASRGEREAERWQRDRRVSVGRGPPMPREDTAPPVEPDYRTVDLGVAGFVPAPQPPALKPLTAGLSSSTFDESTRRRLAESPLSGAPSARSRPPPQWSELSPPRSAGALEVVEDWGAAVDPAGALAADSWCSTPTDDGEEDLEMADGGEEENGHAPPGIGRDAAAKPPLPPGGSRRPTELQKLDWLVEDDSLGSTPADGGGIGLGTSPQQPSTPSWVGDSPRSVAGGGAGNGLWRQGRVAAASPVVAAFLSGGPSVGAGAQSSTQRTRTAPDAQMLRKVAAAFSDSPHDGTSPTQWQAVDPQGSSVIGDLGESFSVPAPNKAMVSTIGPARRDHFGIGADVGASPSALAGRRSNASPSVEYRTPIPLMRPAPVSAQPTASSGNASLASPTTTPLQKEGMASASATDAAPLALPHLPAHLFDSTPRAFNSSGIVDSSAHFFAPHGRSSLDESGDLGGSCNDTARSALLAYLASPLAGARPSDPNGGAGGGNSSVPNAIGRTVPLLNESDASPPAPARPTPQVSPIAAQSYPTANNSPLVVIGKRLSFNQKTAGPPPAFANGLLDDGDPFSPLAGPGAGAGVGRYNLFYMHAATSASDGHIDHDHVSPASRSEFSESGRISNRSPAPSSTGPRSPRTATMGPHANASGTAPPAHGPLRGAGPSLQDCDDVLFLSQQTSFAAGGGASGGVTPLTKTVGVPARMLPDVLDAGRPLSRVSDASPPALRAANYSVVSVSSLPCLDVPTPGKAPPQHDSEHAPSALDPPPALLGSWTAAHPHPNAANPLSGSASLASSRRDTNGQSSGGGGGGAGGAGGAAPPRPNAASPAMAIRRLSRTVPPEPAVPRPQQPLTNNNSVESQDTVTPRSHESVRPPGAVDRTVSDLDATTTAHNDHLAGRRHLTSPDVSKPRPMSLPPSSRRESVAVEGHGCGNTCAVQ